MSDYLIKLCEFANNYNWESFFSQDVPYVFHYTSLNVLAKIAESPNIRFVDRFYLNDYSEGKYVISLCLQIISTLEFPSDKLRKEFKKKCRQLLKKPQYDNFYIFQASFSKSNDNLCLWNYYGKQGCNLGFSTNGLVEGLKPKTRENKNEPRPIHGEVVYNRKKQIRIIRALVKDFFSLENYYTDADLNAQQGIFDRYGSITIDVLLEKIMLAGVFMKAPCFSIEKEYRFAYNLRMIKEEDGQLKHFSVIENEQHFIERESMLSPYVDIEFNKKCLATIGIAPTINFNYAKNSVLRAFSENYPHIIDNTIIKSKIPVRF